jgi:hypothetical protein
LHRRCLGALVEKGFAEVGSSFAQSGEGFLEDGLCAVVVQNERVLGDAFNKQASSLVLLDVVTRAVSRFETLQFAQELKVFATYLLLVLPVRFYPQRLPVYHEVVPSDVAKVRVARADPAKLLRGLVVGNEGPLSFEYYRHPFVKLLISFVYFEAAV